MHERCRCTDDSRESLCSTGAWKYADINFGQSDLVVTVLSDTNVTGEGELEAATHAGAGNCSDGRLAHRVAQCKALIEGRGHETLFFGPFSARRPHRLAESDDVNDRIVSDEVAR